MHQEQETSSSQNIVLPNMASKITQLKHLVVVSNEEGKRLGKVSHIYINPETKKLSGFVVKEDFWSREKLFFSMENVSTVGEDVILVNSSAAGQKILDEKHLQGMSLERLQGHGVITQDGKDLGVFKDANFQANTWELTEIILDKDNLLKVDVSEITIGEDEILVPAFYASSVKKNITNKSGFLNRLMPHPNEEQKS